VCADHLRLGGYATLALAALVLACPLTVRAQSAGAPVLTAGDYADESKLADMLWTRSPDVLDARTSAGVAAGEVTRARTLPNPSLDFTWGTVPVGRTNPPDLHDSLDNVPNYNVGLSELVELAKRGPRQAATTAEFERSRLVALSTLAGRFFSLLEAIGQIAKTQVRADMTAKLVEASEQLLNLDRARASKGDIAVIDVERAEVEHGRLLAVRDAALTELEGARADCAALVAVPCGAFDSAQDARAYLEQAARAEWPTAWSNEIEQRRPDIAALDAALRAAQQRATLAQRRIIPDVTLRLGYTYDTFIVAGNQRNGLSLGIQLPVPVADQGRADLEAATATLMRAAETREALVAAGRAALESGSRRRDLITARMRQLDAALSTARDVQDALIAAQGRGGTSLADVLLARRGYEELLLDRGDLDAEAFEATVKMRQAAASFPRPNGDAQVSTR
jgi:cobalt-zinc-cadmium efflux system outer membrane protein